jgi:hypothetical protein
VSKCNAGAACLADSASRAPNVHASRLSHRFLQAFLISNRDLELKMSKIQVSQKTSSPVASGIADLRRELDEANEERVQVGPPSLSDFMPLKMICLLAYAGHWRADPKDRGVGKQSPLRR